MQKLPMISLLGAISFAALPAFAQNRPVVADDVAGTSSTYTPGPGDSSAVQPYTPQGSAVLAPRGGGPATVTPVRTNRLHRGTRIESDSQTRRPGGANYVRSPDVSMTGDDFTTGSSTHGHIAVRPGNSNEAGFALHGYTDGLALGGGPRDAKFPQWARTSDGALEPLAPSAPIAWGSGALGPKFHGGTDNVATMTRDDVAQLPARGDGTASTHPGLLGTTGGVNQVGFLDNDGIAAARPTAMDASTGFPAISRAIGGGPQDESPAVRFAEDHITR